MKKNELIEIVRIVGARLIFGEDMRDRKSRERAFKQIDQQRALAYQEEEYRRLKKEIREQGQVMRVELKCYLRDIRKNHTIRA